MEEAGLPKINLDIGYSKKMSKKRIANPKMRAINCSVDFEGLVSL